MNVWSITAESKMPSTLVRYAAHAGHQHSITLFTARLHGNGDLFQPRIERRIGDRAFSVAASHACMKSHTDRTETHAVVDINIQAPSEVFFTPRTDYVMHLRADCRRRTTNSAVF